MKRASALLLLALAACAAPPKAPPLPPGVSPQTLAMYPERQDGAITIPAVPAKWLSDSKARTEVGYWGPEKPGSIVVDPGAKYLYYVLPDNRALRYAIAVGKEGKGFKGNATVAFTRDWPRWTPTANMLKNDPALYGPWRGGMEGGLENPLGARALYLYRGGKDTRYRIHGTAYPWSIGEADSAGCIRLYNHDIIDLEERVKPGARVVVLSDAQSGRGTVPPENLADAALLPPGT